MRTDSRPTDSRPTERLSPPDVASGGSPAQHDVRSELDRLERLTDPRGGEPARAVTLARALLPSLTTTRDSVEALFYLGTAYGFLNEQEKACDTFRSIATRARTTRLEKSVEAANAACP
jgi:hypothetical protein